LLITCVGAVILFQLKVKLDIAELSAKVLKDKVHELENHASLKELENRAKVKELENLANLTESENHAKMKELENQGNVKELELEVKVRELENQGNAKALELEVKVNELENQGNAKEIEHQTKVKELENKGNAKEIEHQTKVKELENKAKMRKLEHQTKVKELENHGNAKEIEHQTEVKELENQGNAKEIEHQAKVKELENQGNAKEVEHQTKVKELEHRLDQCMEHKHNAATKGFSETKTELSINPSASVAQPANALMPAKGRIAVDTVQLTKVATTMQHLQEPYFCTASVSNNTKWRKTRKELVDAGLVAPRGGEHRGSYQIPKPPQWYCDKLQNSLRPWEYPKKTSVHDLAIGIYIGEKLYYGQVIAQRDTWLSRVPASHMFGPTSNSLIPVHGLEKYSLKPDYEDPNAVQLVNLYAMKELYDIEPNKKWYFIYGCDNYVNVDYMLLLLDQFDHTQPMWLGRHRSLTPMPDWVNMEKHPKSVSKTEFTWVAGSDSWILSNSAMKAYAAYITTFLDDEEYNFKTTGKKKMCVCPDKIAGLVLSLLGFEVTTLSNPWNKRWSWTNVDAIDQFGDSAWEAKENIVYHYVSPRKMLVADQRAQHEKLDRLVNANAVQGVVNFARETIDHHCRALRKLQVMIKWLAQRMKHFGGKKKRELAQNWGDEDFPYNHYNDIPNEHNTTLEAEPWVSSLKVFDH